MAQVKITVNKDVAPVLERLLKAQIVVIDDGVASRNLSQTLRPLRVRGKLLVGHDRKLGKSLLAVRGANDFKKRKRGRYSSIFEIKLD